MDGKYLKAKREELGLDVTTFAAYLGVSFWTVARWEAGKRNPGLDPFSLKAALHAADMARMRGEALPDWRERGWPGRPFEPFPQATTSEREEVKA